MAEEKEADRVSVRESVGSLLMLRSSVAPLFERISQLESDRILMDFSGVEFMSRSFADEYRNEKARTAKRVVEAHVPAPVRRMLSLVASQAASSRRQRMVPGRPAESSKVVTL